MLDITQITLCVKSIRKQQPRPQSRRFRVNLSKLCNFILQFTNSIRDSWLRSAIDSPHENRQVSLIIIIFQFQLIGVGARRRLFAKPQRGTVRLREKRPAANRPAKKPTNRRKQENPRFGFAYLYTP